MIVELIIGSVWFQSVIVKLILPNNHYASFDDSLIKHNKTNKFYHANVAFKVVSGLPSTPVSIIYI